MKNSKSRLVCNGHSSNRQNSRARDPEACCPKTETEPIDDKHEEQKENESIPLNNLNEIMLEGTVWMTADRKNFPFWGNIHENRAKPLAKGKLHGRRPKVIHCNSKDLRNKKVRKETKKPVTCFCFSLDSFLSLRPGAPGVPFCWSAHLLLLLPLHKRIE